MKLSLRKELLETGHLPGDLMGWSDGNLPPHPVTFLGEELRPHINAKERDGSDDRQVHPKPLDLSHHSPRLKAQGQRLCNRNALTARGHLSAVAGGRSLALSEPVSSFTSQEHGPSPLCGPFQLCSPMRP